MSSGDRLARLDQLGKFAGAGRATLTGVSDKELLAEGLRRYPTWGHAYIAEKQRADRLATVVKDAWGSLLAYYTDISETEVQRLIASCESVNDLLGGAK